MLKTVILINFILLVIGLFSGLVFVYKDEGNGNRVLLTLVIRVGLAASLVTLIAYGLYSGQVGARSPWGSFSNANNNVKAEKSIPNTLTAPQNT